MNETAHHKITAGHLSRGAFLYVRQSTLRQVLENTESTKRQYDLRQRAIALGWPPAQVVTIDHDLGQSGASAADRKGFQQLVTEVGLGHAGIVMGLEVSRLARNCTDWHRLLEICALTDTLILDEDGVYDPAHFNDRLLLGLKGTMSEAELHMLKARLVGGAQNKARRGELQVPLPIGFRYDGQGSVKLDPDQQIQEAIGLFFATFRRTGSATATVKAFRGAGTLFPHRIRYGINKGDIMWGELTHARTLEVLHNPRFAGAFCWGRTRQRRRADGKTVAKMMEREDWIALLPAAHPGYITWADFEENLQRLRDNSAAHGQDRKHGPAREGPALLQGLVVCGRCGSRMTVRYHQRSGGEQLYPDYVCASDTIQRGESPCQSVVGIGVDEAVGKVLVESMTPMVLEVALAVQEELQRRIQDADRLRGRQVERASYDTDLARRRYMQVDPANRLVADSLEAEWNEKLRTLRSAQEDYERQREADRAVLSQQERARILELARDFPALWKAPKTPARERKRMVRLLVEDVTLIKATEITVHIRLRGGTTQTLVLPLPAPAWKLRQTDATVVAEVDRLLETYTDKQVARIMDTRGHRSGEGKRLNRLIIRNIRLAYGLASHHDRLRRAGMLTRSDLATRLGVSTATIGMWRRTGLLRASASDDRGHYLYEDPGSTAPIKHKYKGITRATQIRRLATNTTHEV